jgi:hypothetical protein
MTQRILNSTQAPGGGIISQNLAANGHVKFSGGYIEQWGTAYITVSGQVITFDIPFPNACFVVIPVDYNSPFTLYGENATTNQFQVAVGSTNVLVSWIARGW